MAQIPGIEIFLDVRVSQETVDRDYKVNALASPSQYSLSSRFGRLYFFDLLSDGDLNGQSGDGMTTGYIMRYKFTDAGVSDLDSAEASLDWYETETAHIFQSSTTTAVSAGTLTADWFLNEIELLYNAHDSVALGAEVISVLTSTQPAVSGFAEEDPGNVGNNGIKLVNSEDANLVFTYWVSIRK